MTRHDTPTVSETAPPTDRAQRLKTATQTTHERLDSSIMAARPFESLENYARFLQFQHVFHRDAEPLYTAPALQELLPGLASRTRMAAVAADLGDLGCDTPEALTPPAGAGLDTPEALGWLYVIEGSNLGAAFLFKAALKMGLSADHGARHLAEAPEGRAPAWRSFKAALDAARLPASDEARVIAGAEAAFQRARELVAVFLTPETAG